MVHEQSPAEATRSRLRINLAALAKGLPAATQGAYDELVKDLDLGPEPELRDCPHCKHTGLKAATRCGRCWAKLTPPA